MTEPTTFTYANQTVNRLGFGAMRITGEGIWGPPRTRRMSRGPEARVELGVNLIDTADSYGPYVSEELIREALTPTARSRSRPSRILANRPTVRECGRRDYLRQDARCRFVAWAGSIDLFQLQPH